MCWANPPKSGEFGPGRTRNDNLLPAQSGSKENPVKPSAADTRPPDFPPGIHGGGRRPSSGGLPPPAQYVTRDRAQSISRLGGYVMLTQALVGEAIGRA